MFKISNVSANVSKYLPSDKFPVCGYALCTVNINTNSSVPLYFWTTHCNINAFV